MWYEILPSFTIITVALAMPDYVIMPIINYLCLGTRFRRRVETAEERMLYIHDRRITGNPYKMQWCIPDAEDQCDEGGKNGGDARHAAGEAQQEGAAGEKKIN